MNEAKKRLALYITVIVVALASVVGSAIFLAASQDNRREAICQAVVQGRADNRAMWLFLLGMQTGKPHTATEQQQIDAFTTALNQKLPPLQCVNDSAVPEPAPTPEAATQSPSSGE